MQDYQETVKAFMGCPGAKQRDSIRRLNADPTRDRPKLAPRSEKKPHPRCRLIDPYGLKTPMRWFPHLHLACLNEGPMQAGRGVRTPRGCWIRQDQPRFVKALPSCTQQTHKARRSRPNRCSND